jgi:hypothetical protein
MNAFEKIFNSYAREAFRLETLPEYRIDEEWINFQNYRATGALVQDADLKHYLEQVSNDSKNGKRHIRARSFQIPPSEYLRFETQIGYLPQSQHGCEFAFIEQANLEKLCKEITESHSLRDFWLFDETHLFFIHYNSQGEFQGIVQETDPVIIESSIRLKNQILQDGKPLDAFLRLIK